MTRCPRPDKIPYYSRAEAEAARTRLAAKGTVVESYECACGHWHVGGAA